MRPQTQVTILRQTAESDSFRYIVETRHLVEAANTIERLVSLLAELTDRDDCQYDHHGYCQAHWLHERPCPHERAKALLGDGGQCQ